MRFFYKYYVSINAQLIGFELVIVLTMYREMKFKTICLVSFDTMKYEFIVNCNFFLLYI